MTQMYLMIENPGVAEDAAFTLLGATTKRNAQSTHVIGTFGSGNKHAVSVCLRHHLSPVIYCGNLRLQFGTREQTMEKTTFERVQVKYGGKDKSDVNRSGTEDLGFVLDYGAADWAGLDLALREFVSNSIDRAVQEYDNAWAFNYVKEHNIDPHTWEESQKEQIRMALTEHQKSAEYAPWNDVVITVVEGNKVRAKAGATRVFVPMNDEVFAFKQNLGKWFLHFSEPHLLHETILPKAQRNIGDRKTAVIYRRGVRVREFAGSNTPSLFDYNLPMLKLDESRQVDDYTVRNMATLAISDADADVLQRLFLSMVGDEETRTKYWEHGFDEFYLKDWFPSGSTNLQARQEKWAKAARAAFGNSVIVSHDLGAETVKRKGHKSVKLPHNFVSAAEKYTKQTILDVLTQDDREGRDVIAPMADAITAVNMVWECLTSFNMTKDKPQPAAFCFHQMMDQENMKFGFQRGDAVYFNANLCTTEGNAAGLTDTLLQTAVEEVAHYVTGATDNSRDFQDFAFLLAMKLMRLRVGV